MHAPLKQLPLEYRMRLFRLFLGIGVLIAAGCSTGEAPKSLKFSGDDNTKGLIIVGAAISRYDTFLGAPAYQTAFNLDLHWVKWDRGTSLPSPDERQTIHVKIPGCQLGVNIDNCDLRTMTYHVIEAPPGDYRLTEISYESPHIIHNTKIVDSAQVMTHVGPGEIVYIGELTLDTLASPVRLVKYARNDFAATAARAAYPDIHGDITFRKPTLAGAE